MLVASPVCTGDAQQLDGFNLTGRIYMRAPAKVDERALLIYCYFIVFQFVD
jgi:hypothetical protein